MYAGTAIRRTRERRFKLRGLHEDGRTPHLRLGPVLEDPAPRSVPIPEFLDTEQSLENLTPAVYDHTENPVTAPQSPWRSQTNELVFVQVIREQSRKSYGIKLHPIRAKPQQSFTLRETTCPYLEGTAQHRRCMAQQPKQITLKCQAAYCLGPRHRRCAYYRQARGFPTIPPERLAAYTVAVALVIVLTLTAGILAVTHGDSAVAGSQSNSKVITNHP